MLQLVAILFDAIAVVGLLAWQPRRQPKLAGTNYIPLALVGLEILLVFLWL